MDSFSEVVSVLQHALIREQPHGIDAGYFNTLDLISPAHYKVRSLPLNPSPTFPSCLQLHFRNPTVQDAQVKIVRRHRGSTTRAPSLRTSRYATPIRTLPESPH